MNSASNPENTKLLNLSNTSDPLNFSSFRAEVAHQGGGIAPPGASLAGQLVGLSRVDGGGQCAVGLGATEREACGGLRAIIYIYIHIYIYTYIYIHIHIYISYHMVFGVCLFPSFP